MNIRWVHLLQRQRHLDMSIATKETRHIGYSRYFYLMKRWQKLPIVDNPRRHCPLEKRIWLDKYSELREEITKKGKEIWINTLNFHEIMNVFIELKFQWFMLFTLLKIKLFFWDNNENRKPFVNKNKKLFLILQFFFIF